MRRILATSIAAAIPAVLPVHAVDAISYPVDKPAPPVASGHYRPARAHHAKHHSRYAPAPVTETRNGIGRGPENDVKVDANNDGNPAEKQGAPDRSEPAGAHGAVGAPAAEPGVRGGHKSTHNRPRAAHGRSASRPDTGAESGFADADDPALPPEAAEAIKEAETLQNNAQQAGGPGRTAPGTTAPNAGTPGAGAAPQGTPQGGPQGTPQGAAPAAPKGAVPAAPAAPKGAAGRANPVTNESTNHKFSRMAVTQAMPVAYFNAIPGARGAHLVLHTTVGNAPEHTVTLQCDPPGGTHPRAAAACADVDKAGGDLAQLPASKNARACFMIYSPVSVTAQGSWHGQPVQFTKKYPNTCVMREKTGSVFDF